MSEFPDLDSFFEPIVLSVHGKKYALPRVSAEGGIKYQVSKDPKNKPLTDPEFDQIFLGDVGERMLADGVQPSDIQRARLVAYADFSRDRQDAEMLWRTGGDPKAQTEYRKGQQPQVSTPSPSTGGESETPSPASTKATTSRKS